MESQDESLIATDPVSRESRDTETQGERKKGPEKKNWVKERKIKRRRKVRRKLRSLIREEKKGVK